MQVGGKTKKVKYDYDEVDIHDQKQ